MARNRAVVGIVTLVILAACGGAATPDSTAAASVPAATAAGTSTLSTAVAPTSTVSPALPSIVGFFSGRGDDGSLEVGIWLASDPFESAEYRVVVGTDADDSFPGTGNPFEHLEGHLELTPAGSAIFDGSELIATGSEIQEYVSWGQAEGVLRVFFIGSVPPKAGTTWVIVEVDGHEIVGGTAGSPFGSACSYRDAGLDLAPVVVVVPEAEFPCRYPLG